MRYIDAKRQFSEARMGKYLRAMNGDKKRAMQLYRHNLILSQRFYGLISVFEVELRNAIDKHYKKQYRTKDWIVSEAKKGRMLAHDEEDIRKIERAYKQAGVYSHDKMVGSFTFGFWTYMFTRNNYKLGGKTLLEIFPNRPKGTTQKQVYTELTQIRQFRNRIAHHEPICFDGQGNADLSYIEYHYNMMLQYFGYITNKPDSLLKLIEQPEPQMMKLKEFLEK